MSAEFYIGILLGFFAGLSAGLVVAIALTMSWLNSVQTRLVGDTVAEILDELGISEEDDDATEGSESEPEVVEDSEDYQDEWWKRGS